MKKKTPAGRPEFERGKRSVARPDRRTDSSKDPMDRVDPVDPAQTRTARDGRIRLNKYLAQNGVASRRKADQLISEGEVMVDGEIMTELGYQVDPARQRVEIDGVVLRPEGERHRYYLLNKPSGVVCTSDVRETRPRAIDLIGDRKKGRIYTVGRLDEETIGLVLLTNDGDFANRISHPRYGIEKTYRVVVVGWVRDEMLTRLRHGVRLSDFRSNFAHVKLLKRSDHQSTLVVSLQEGRNREVRRVFAKVGLPVKSLRRVAIGGLTERGLKIGHWRPLTRDEVNGLLEQAERGEAIPPPSGAGRGYAKPQTGHGPIRGVGAPPRDRQRGGYGSAGTRQRTQRSSGSKSRGSR